MTDQALTTRPLIGVLAVHGRHLEPLDFYGSPVVVDGDTRLLPLDVLRRCVVALETALVPADETTAAKLAAAVVGTRQSRELVDAKTYLRVLGGYFSEHPRDIGIEVVDHLTRTLKFLPSPAEVHCALTKIADRRKGQMRVAQAQVDEYARRKVATKAVQSWSDMTLDEREALDRQISAAKAHLTGATPLGRVAGAVMAAAGKQATGASDDSPGGVVAPPSPEPHHAPQELNPDPLGDRHGVGRHSERG